MGNVIVHLHDFKNAVTQQDFQSHRIAHSTMAQAVSELDAAAGLSRPLSISLEAGPQVVKMRGVQRNAMPESTPILASQAIRRALSRIAHEIAEQNEQSHAVAILGIQRGGVHLAERLARDLSHIWGHPVPMGTLDVGMHRDDLDQKAAPEILPTVIPFDVKGKTVILVDDVLFSGRTARAALDALNDFGRAQKVQLVVLVDRGHRELPIKADFVGKYVTTNHAQRVEVRLADDGGEDAVYLQIP